MEPRTVELFLDLIRIDALSCNEKPVADYIRSVLEPLGMSVTEDDTASITGSNTGNLIARYKDGGRKVLLSHMDTARPTRDLVPQITNGKIHGSGGTILGADNRAGCAILLASAEQIIKHQPDVPGFTLAFTVCEETTLGGSKNLNLDPAIAGGFVFDSSNLPGRYIYSACGAKMIRIEIVGRASHSGIEPEKGINAIAIAARALAQIKQGRLDEQTTMNFGIIKGGSAVNVVPDRVVLHGEVRSFDTKRVEEEVARLKDVFETETLNSGGSLIFADEWDFTPYTVDRNVYTIPAIEAAISAAGMKPEPVISLGGSDANSLNANGIPSVNIGIGAKNPHADDEYIMEADLMKATGIALALLVQP